MDVKNELTKFKRDIGVEFLRLVGDVQYRAIVRVGNHNKTDTDQDKIEIQKMYEPLQKNW